MKIGYIILVGDRLDISHFLPRNRTTIFDLPNKTDQRLYCRSIGLSIKQNKVKMAASPEELRLGELRETWCAVDRMSEEDWCRKQRGHLDRYKVRLVEVGSN